MVAMTTSVAAATTITPGTTEPGKLTNISLPIVAGMITVDRDECNVMYLMKNVNMLLYKF